MNIETLINSLPFVKSHGIEVLSAENGRSAVRVLFSEQFSSPPNLFPAAMVGMIGDVAAIAACLSAAPPGSACATLDYTVKMTGQAAGEALLAEGHVLQSGKTISVGTADIYVLSGGDKKHCGAVLATARVFEIRS